MKPKRKHQTYFTLKNVRAVDLLKKQNPNSIKARVRQPVSIGPFGSLLQRFVYQSIHPLFLVRGKSSSFAGELTSMSKQWAALKSKDWWECQPVKSGGEWDESGATGQAAACYCPLRCVLIPLPFPSMTEPQDRSATAGYGVWVRPGQTRGRGVQQGSCGGVARNN